MRACIRWAARSRGLVIALGLLLVCAQLRAAETLVFAVGRLPLSLPIYVAQERGYFQKEGVALRIVDCQLGRECLARVMDGAADIATVADSPLVFASLRGQRFAVLATMTTARNYTKIVTRRDSGVVAVADLGGRRVGTLMGTSAQYFLDLSLMFSAVDPARVTVVALEASESAAVLGSGRVDAIAIFEPYAFQAARQLGPDARVLANPPLRRENWNLVASERAADTRSAALGRVCRAIDRANEFIGENPAAARTILRHRLGLDEPTIDWVWSDLEFRLQLSQSLIASLEGQARWAIQSRYVVGPAPDYLGYIRQEILSSVLPAAVFIAR